VHGTYFEPLLLIKKGGLNKMARNHVHLAVGYPGSGVISGMRGSCQVVIEVNMVKAIYGPHKISFFISNNKVILTEGLADGSVPPQYFIAIYDFKKNKYIEEAPIDYLCVFTSKFSCEDPKAKLKKTQELILFSLTIVDLANGEVKD